MAYSDCARPTRRCTLNRSSTLYVGGAIGPTPDTGATRLYLGSAIAGVVLVVALVMSVAPAGVLQ